MIVTIVPISKRAKQRVQQHGAEMEILRRHPFNGEPAILVQSLEKTYRCGGVEHKWTGWFTEKEVEIP